MYHPVVKMIALGFNGVIRPVPAASPTAKAAWREKGLVQKAQSGHLRVERHAIWGMSVQSLLS